jgi:hypothetical protein
MYKQVKDKTYLELQEIIIIKLKIIFNLQILIIIKMIPKKLSLEKEIINKNYKMN